MRTAVIHDWLGPMTGAERVLEQILLCFPGADVFTTIDYLPDEHRRILHGSRVVTSFIQRLPASRTRYWDYIALMPLAVEQFDLASYDLVISNSHTIAKGVITHPHQVHVSYVMSPMRFAWDLQSQYLRDFRVTRGLKGAIARVVFQYLRLWDHAATARSDELLAVSQFIARRIEVCYRREATVLYPPVDLDFYTPGGAGREDFYLAASRLTPFKRLDVIVQAFAQMPERRLVVIGDGPERERIRTMAPRNVQLLGYRSDEVLRDHMRRARAFVFSAPEDFGIVMAEAQACGAPVIALGAAGALEIVQGLERTKPTGVFFSEQTPAAIRDAVVRFEAEAHRITPERCRENVERFDPAAFRDGLTRAVNQAIARYGRR